MNIFRMPCGSRSSQVDLACQLLGIIRRTAGLFPYLKDSIFCQTGNKTIRSRIGY